MFVFLSVESAIKTVELRNGARIKQFMWDTMGSGLEIFDFIISCFNSIFIIIIIVFNFIIIMTIIIIIIIILLFLLLLFLLLLSSYHLLQCYY